MRDFFSPLKKSGKYLRFLFLTGISKFSQMSIFSELNNLQNISMTDDYSSICGITEEELLTQMQTDIEIMAQANGETYAEACVHLKQQYVVIISVNHLFIKDLMRGDVNGCMERTRSFFASISYDLENNLEKHYQTVFYLLFRLMGQYVDAEVKSAIGRADVVVKMTDTIYVFEFKVDGSAEEALAQINSKQYAIPYKSDHRKVVKVGVNFDSATRTIGEWAIEEQANGCQV